MSMIIESLPGSAPASRAGRLVPAEIAGVFARDGVERAGCIAGALEGFERFASHRGVDVEVRYARHGAELLEHEEDDAVMHEAAPVASSNQVAFFAAEPRRFEARLGIAQESFAMARLDHPVQVVVDPERLHAALERERVGAVEPFYAGELARHVASLALDDDRVGRVVRALVDRRRDPGHRWQVIAAVLAFDV